jgi:hypothetical protein
MCPGEREEVMLEIPACPARGSMAALAIGCPAVRGVVGGPGLCESPLMAELTLSRSSAQLSDSRLEVAALTRSPGVRARQRPAGFLLMVEREVFPERIPSACNVTDPAVTGRCPVRHERTPLFTPALPRDY